MSDSNLLKPSRPVWNLAQKPDFGQRVQLSVFECQVGDTEMVKLRHQLLEEMNPSEDSIRFYFLGEDPSKRVEHHGQKPSIDFNDALIV